MNMAKTGAWRRRAAALWWRAWGPLPPGAQEHWLRFRAVQVLIAVVIPALYVTFLHGARDLLIAAGVAAGLGLAVLVVGRTRR